MQIRYNQKEKKMTSLIFATIFSALLVLSSVIKSSRCSYITKSPQAATVEARRNESTLITFIVCDLATDQTGVLYLKRQDMSSEVQINGQTMPHHLMIANGYIAGAWSTTLESHSDCHEIGIRIWNGYDTANETVEFEFDIVRTHDISSIGERASFIVTFEAPLTTTTAGDSTSSTTQTATSLATSTLDAGDVSSSLSSLSQTLRVKIVAGGVAGVVVAVVILVLLVVIVIVRIRRGKLTKEEQAEQGGSAS